MIGPEGAATQVTGWLTDATPRRLRLLEDRYGLDPGALPDPSRVADHETGPLALEDWPAVYVLPQRMTTMRALEQGTDTGAELYLCTYLIRVLAWVRAEDYAGTDELRKRYVLALREALLERKQLTAAPAYGTTVRTGDNFAVVPGSLVEDYSEVFTDDAKRTIAGATLDVAVTVVEVLDGPATMGAADTTTLDVTALGRDSSPEHTVTHPGLM